MLMKKDNLIFTTGIIFLLLVITLCSFLFIKNKNIKTAVSTNLKTEIIKTPEATSHPEINYKDKEVEVLNATKTKGLAKIYADKLVSLGYTKVTIGNYTEPLESNLLLSPSDFSSDLAKIGFNNYKFEKSKSVKIIVAK